MNPSGMHFNPVNVLLNGFEILLKIPSEHCEFVRVRKTYQPHVYVEFTSAPSKNTKNNSVLLFIIMVLNTILTVQH